MLSDREVATLVRPRRKPWRVVKLVIWGFLAINAVLIVGAWLVGMAAHSW